MKGKVPSQLEQYDYFKHSLAEIFSWSQDFVVNASQLSFEMACSKRLNEEVWKDIEKRNDKEKRQLLEWQLQAREPIKKFSEIKKGDHLVQKTSHGGKVFYYHHFLCTGSDGEDRPIIIHYFNTIRNAFSRFVKIVTFGSGSAFEQIALVQELTLPHKDLVRSESELQKKGAEVERVVWPEELKRYSVDEVIERARKRIGEKNYDLAKNNCESFVMWCLCDNNISLQATNSVLALKEIVSGLIRTLFRGSHQLPNLVTEIIEKKVGWTAFGNQVGKEGIESISGLGSIFGVVVTLVVEIGYAAYSIYKAKQKWNEGMLIKTKEEFTKEVVDAVVMSFSRAAGCIGGMFVGQIIFPIPFAGSFIGGIIGTFIGHLVGAGITNSGAIASVANKLIDYFRNFWPRHARLCIT